MHSDLAKNVCKEKNVATFESTVMWKKEHPPSSFKTWVPIPSSEDTKGMTYKTLRRDF